MLAYLLLLCLVAPAFGGLAFNPAATAAQAEDISKSDPPRGFWRDEKEIWTTPLHLSCRRSIAFGIVAASAGLIIAFDERISRSLREYKNDHKWLRDWGPRFTQLVDFPYSLGWAGLFIAGGLLARDHRALDTGLLAIAAIVHCNLVAQPLKFLSNRRRPYFNGEDHWYGPAGIGRRLREGNPPVYNSFPSGHTISAWCLATVISQQYRDKKWVPPLCYTLATLVAISRVSEQQHWTSDVFVGAALGFAVGKMVVRNHNRRHAVVPVVSAGKGGISISLCF